MEQQEVKRPVQISVPEKSHRWLKEEAKRLDRSVNWVINQLINVAQQAKAVQQ